MENENETIKTVGAELNADDDTFKKIEEIMKYIANGYFLQTDFYYDLICKSYININITDEVIIYLTVCIVFDDNNILKFDDEVCRRYEEIIEKYKKSYENWKTIENNKEFKKELRIFNILVYISSVLICTYCVLIILKLLKLI